MLIWEWVLGRLGFLEHDPGPNSVNKTGSSRRPWRRPRRMTRMIILVKVTMT